MKKNILVLFTLLFAISSVFSNDGIFFYENELFTVVKSGTVNFGSAVFTQGGKKEISRTSLISKCGSIAVAETTGVLTLDTAAVLGTTHAFTFTATDAAINPTTTSDFPLAVNRNPNFTLATNGVNCLCENAAVGDAGSLAINGKQKRFTKRTVAERNVLINTEQIFSYRRLCTKNKPKK